MDQDQEREALMRQRQMAALLMQQGQAPQGQMVSGRYVQPSWTQYLASGLANYRGQKMNSEAEAKQKAMAEALQAKKEAWLNSMPKDQAAQTMDAGSIDPSLADVGPIETAPAKQATGDDYLAWAMKGMQVDPQAAQFGMKIADRQEGRQMQQQQAQALREQRMQELQMKMQDARLSAQERQQAQQEAARLQREFLAEQARQAREQQVSMARLTASMRPAPDPHLVQVEGPDGKPQWLPAAQAAGKNAYNKTDGKTEQSKADKVKDANEAIAIIDQAAPIIDEATGSGIGNAFDTVAGFFGKSTTGAQGAAKLKALEGMLVSKMPKMSGPQSDKDVLLYRQMAAQIGDPNIPRETKKAALAEVRRLQVKYAGGTGEPAADPAAAPANGGKNIVVDW